MLRSIALWLLDLVYGSLDTDLQKDVDAVKAKITAAQEAQRDAQAELNGLLAMRVTLDQEAVAVKQAISATQTALEAARREKDHLAATLDELDGQRANLAAVIAERKREIDELSDHDVLRLPIG